MNNNLSNILKVVIYVYENNSNFIQRSRKRNENKQKLNKCLIKKTYGNLNYYTNRLNKMSLLKKPKLYYSKKDLFEIGELIFEDSILTGNASLEFQGIKKEKYNLEIDFKTFYGRNRKIEDENINYEISFYKEKTKYLKEFENEIISSDGILYYTVEKSLLDKIEIDLKKGNKHSDFSDIKFTEYEFDLEKLKKLSHSYNEKVRIETERFIKIFEEENH